MSQDFLCGVRKGKIMNNLLSFVNTGDNQNFTKYIIIAVVALAVLVAAFVLFGSKSDEENEESATGEVDGAEEKKTTEEISEDENDK